MERKKTVLINGKPVEYWDFLVINTLIKFSFIDRIRILFGRPVISKQTIYTEHKKLIVVGTGSEVSVQSVFQKKETPKETSIDSPLTAVK